MKKPRLYLAVFTAHKYGRSEILVKFPIFMVWAVIFYRCLAAEYLDGRRLISLHGS